MEIARDLNPDAINEIATALPQLLADVFSLYVKTKNFHWHMRGPQFRDYHLLLDEHAEQIFTMTDDIAERQARSAPRRCIPSATSRGTSASRTMTTTRLAPGTC
jgi:DNA-binding ferritin-like protein